MYFVATRVTQGKQGMGRCFMFSQNLFSHRLSAHETHSLLGPVRPRRFQAVLGDREAVVDTYREFVVFDDAQIYPEYVIIYTRSFD